MPQKIPLVPGVGPIVERYDAVILDLWGVIHDGVSPYPGVRDSLQRLVEADIPFCLLTNAPRRADAIARQLARMGFAPEHYPAIISSGEATWLGLKERHEPFFDGVGARCLHIGPDRDDGLFDGLGLAIVEDVAQADLIVNTGPWRDEETVADYAGLLTAAAAADVPMVCANPDLEVIRGGHRIICAGALARHYEGLGGRVLYYGKPHPPIYRACLRKLGKPSPDRVIAIGDSLGTDIAGAAGMGIDSIFVAGGIHGAELGIDGGGTAAEEKIAMHCAEKGLSPVAAVAALTW